MDCSGSWPHACLPGDLPVPDRAAGKRCHGFDGGPLCFKPQCTDVLTRSPCVDQMTFRPNFCMEAQ